MDILIIGNGFDIAHDLKTSYKDFLECCKNEDYKEYCNTNLWMKHFLTRQKELGDTWIDLENEIYRVIENIKEIPVIKKNSFRELLCPQLLSIYKNDMSFSFYNINQYLHQPKYEPEVSIEEYTKEVYVNNKDTFYVYIKSSKGFINFLYDQLREFTQVFNIYLNNNVILKPYNKSKYMLSLFQNGQQNRDCDVYVLSFNYTDTCEKLYNGCYNSYGKFNIKPYYVHGKVCNSDECNLVLGTHSFDNNGTSSNTSPIPVDFNVFRKHNQRHRYGTIENYQNLLMQLNLPGRIIKPVFHVIGHSLDKTDHNILKHIFLINKNAKINLYYHNEEAQEKLINNITEIIGEEEVMTKVRLIYQHDENRGILRPTSD